MMLAARALDRGKHPVTLYFRNSLNSDKVKPGKVRGQSGQPGRWLGCLYDTVASTDCLSHDWATQSCPEVQPALGGKAWLP